MDICGEVSDEEIIDSTEELKPLKDILEGRKVEDFAEIVKHQKAPVADRLDKIPVQIDEAERAKPDESEMQFDEGQRQFVISMIERKTQELNDITGGVKVTKLRADLEIHKKELNSLTTTPVGSSREEMIVKQEISQLGFENKNKQREIEQCERWSKEADENIEKDKQDGKQLEMKWQSVMDVVFTDDVCPTCGQKLPPDKLEEHKHKFNIDKSNQLDAIEKQLEALKRKIQFDKGEKEKNEDKIRSLKADVEENDKKMKSLADELRKVSAKKDEERAKEVAFLQERIEVLKSEIDKASNANDADKIRVEISELENEKNSYDEKVAMKQCMRDSARESMT